MKQKLYEELAQLVGAWNRCLEPGPRAEWADRHRARIRELIKKHLPHGSGFDSGTAIDLQLSAEDKLVFTTSFHHMDDAGYYDGWTEHTVIIKPSLAHRFQVRVTGRNRNDIKDLIAEEFRHALEQDVDACADAAPTQEQDHAAN